MRKYREYTDEQFIQAAKEASSMAGMLKILGLRPAGGNYAHAKKIIQRLSVDCSHWSGQAWNKDQQLKDWSEYSRVGHLKKHLIRERGHKCEDQDCQLETWKGQPIGLEVHHVDGDRTNNDGSNLKLLCGNCHYTTPNFRNRKSLV